MSDNPARTARGRGRARNPSGAGVAAPPGGLQGAGIVQAAPPVTPTVPASSNPVVQPAMPTDSSATVAPTTLTLAKKSNESAGRGRMRNPSGASPGGMTIRPPATPTVVSTTTVVSTSSTNSNNSSKFVQRPDFGKIGRTIDLRTNSYYVNFNNSMMLHRYDVEIKCEIREAKMDDSFLVFWEANRQGKFITEPYGAIYDGGKTCYSLNKLVMNKELEYKASLEVDLPSFQRPVRYGISLKYIGERKIDFSNRDTKNEALTVLEMVYRQLVNSPEGKKRQNYFAPYGANAFYVPQPGDRWRLDLDGGREAWCGYYLASKWATGQLPILNIDISNGIFLKQQSTLAFMCDIFNQRTGRVQYTMAQLQCMTKPHTLSRQEVAALLDAMKGLQVKKEGDPTHTYKIRGITDLPADQMTFEWRQQNRTISVAQYFQERYGGLKYPFFPCLIIGQGKKRGDSYFPMEKCELVVPQRVRGKLTEMQTATLIKGVCTDAVERGRRIEEMMKLGSLYTDPFAAKFGFKLNPKMMELQGRVLAPPTLEYAQQARIAPRDGAWNMGPSIKLYGAASIPCFGMVTFLGQANFDELKTFCHALMQMCKNMGMNVPGPYPESVVWLNNRTLPDIRQGFEQCIRECAGKGKKCELILVPMAARSTAEYGHVKGIAEQEIGIATQVVLLRNIRQNKPQTLSNIVLKINAKMGGINCKLFSERVAEKYLLNKPTLILGLDVTHSNPTEKKMPSIGAAVENIDMVPAKFCASVNVQRFRGEPVVYLRKALEERVAAFWANCKVKPERVIVYRDGVDDGYFNQVMTEECKSIRQAVQERVGSDFEPKITFIIVQKRHHARFFCAQERDMCGKAKNVPPGTVVDKTVTHPNRFDFFLCSHFGIQGTSRPTHYTVLRDDNNFDPDELQAITYQLCHMYFRCTRSVSIPAPTYYAHLACERARHHVNILSTDPKRELFSDETSSIVTGSSSSTTSSEEESGKLMNVLEPLMTKMYFC